MIPATPDGARGDLAERVRLRPPGAPPFLPRGSGSGPAGTPVENAVPLPLTDLDRVVEHAVDDLTVTVEAGVRVTDLRDRLDAAGQWIPALVGLEGTVGGVLAGDRRGPHAGRWGGLRDGILGVTLLRGSGAEVRAGGRVVKNVAGYDLGRLVAGSLGVFGPIVELTLRVEPRPPAVLHTWTPGEPAHPGAAVTALAAWNPEAILRERREGTFGWSTRFAGPRARADAFAGETRSHLGPTTRVEEGLSREGAPAGSGWFHGGALPAFLATCDPERIVPGGEARLDLLRGHVHGRVPDDLDPDALVAARAALVPGEGVLHLGVAPDHPLAARAWGRDPGPEADLWRAVKRALDPDGVWAGGRLPGGV